MKVFGSQIIAEFIRCSSEQLNQSASLERLLTDGIQKYNLTLKSINSYQFEPFGVTAIAIIGESHVAIHTYPEEQHASIDIFTCSPGSQGPELLLKYLQDHLKPQQVRHKTIARGNKIAIDEQDYIVDFSRGSFDIRYHIRHEYLNRRTAYQHMRMIENKDFGTLLFLDNELQIASNDAHLYNQSMVSPLLKRGASCKKIAILGGGDGGVLHECLKHEPEKVYVIDIDREVIAASKEYLPQVSKGAFDDPKAHIVVGEALKFLETHQGFDTLIYDLTLSPEITAIHDRDRYFSSLFQAMKDSLLPQGMVSLRICSAQDQDTFQYLSNQLGSYFKNTEYTEVFIPSFCGVWRFATCTKN